MGQAETAELQGVAAGIQVAISNLQAATAGFSAFTTTPAGGAVQGTDAVAGPLSGGFAMLGDQLAALVRAVTKLAEQAP